MTDPLNFGSGPDPFTGFDAVPGPDSFDLSGFDAATGSTTVPQGPYLCRVERGELTKTKSGKLAYRLCLKTVAPIEHAGFTLWRWFVMADDPGTNRAKRALAPLGFKSGADLRRPFPPIGEDVFVKALVTLRNDPHYGPTNDVQRFEPCDPPDAFASSPPSVNPFGVKLPTPTEGGTQ